MYKLFINNKVVYLCQNPASVDNLMHEDFIIEPYTTKENFASTLKVVLSDVNQNNVILHNANVEKMFQEVCANFICIEAAGGVVENTNGEILLIHRRGFWDLPKGKIEKDETIEDAALREVEEETGLANVRITKPVRFKKLNNTATYHSYMIDDKLALKVSHWFEMKTDFEGDLIPQTEEDIEQAIWVNKTELPTYFDNMYSSIIDVLKEI
ncbi:MAG: NUDIX domain-containing protein [Chitinophagales bacterium]